jgi:NADPH:quinone reductase-like Zn-dependent oxidoreductase
LDAAGTDASFQDFHLAFAQDMKAVIHSNYGSADKVLSVQEVDKPTPNDDEVLVRVRAASMHADVWHVIEGVPLLLRLMGNGVSKPKRLIPGTDFAGVIESIGKNVTPFKPGDEVFGASKFGWVNGGAYAEYVAVPKDLVVLKPANVSFEQAASVPTAGMIALSNLGGASRQQGTRKILINGAGGSTGTIALQIAKSDGAHVTTVDCADKLPMLRALGADHVIDYATEDYLRNGERYDFIMDVISIRAPEEYKHALTDTGAYVPIGHAQYDSKTNRVLGSMPYFISLLIRGLLDPKKRSTMKMLHMRDALEIFRSLLESGKLTPMIGKTFSLSEVAEAIRCMQEGKTVGRIIITP